MKKQEMVDEIILYLAEDFFDWKYYVWELVERELLRWKKSELEQEMKHFSIVQYYSRRLKKIK